MTIYKVLKIFCDLCNKEENFTLELNDHTLPTGWSKINRKDACPNCYNKFVQNEKRKIQEEKAEKVERYNKLRNTSFELQNLSVPLCVSYPDELEWYKDIKWFLSNVEDNKKPNNNFTGILLYDHYSEEYDYFSFSWYMNNKLHREDGPAYISFVKEYPDTYYLLDDILFYEDEKLIKKITGISEKRE